MLLQLDRPVIFFDVETHEKCSPEQARIVEIAFIQVKPDGKTHTWKSLVNPGVPIHPATTDIHKITDDMVKNAPSFAKIAPHLLKGFVDCDYAGYNVKFDLRVLQGEMNRANVKWSYADARLVDGLRLWQVAEPRTLTDAVKRFLQREPSEAHRADGDIKDTMDVVESLLLHFTALPRSVQQIHDLCFPINPDWIDADGKIVWKGNVAVLSFGKHGGKPLDQIDKGYISWILTNDFPEATKVILRKVLDGTLPSKEQ